MRPRRFLVGMTVGLAIATVALAILQRPVLAVVFGAWTIAQGIAAAITPRGRAVLTVVFTDVVDSTRNVAELGDDAWRERFEMHGSRLRREFGRLPAVVIKDLGDGFMAAFPFPAPRPTQVVETALQLSTAAQDLGLKMRTGVHAGECHINRNDVRGLAVHVAARLMDAADPGQVVISSSVRELLGGTTLAVAALGERALRGLDEPLRIYSVESRSPDVL